MVNASIPADPSLCRKAIAIANNGIFRAPINSSTLSFDFESFNFGLWCFLIYCVERLLKSKTHTEYIPYPEMRHFMSYKIFICKNDVRCATYKLGHRSKNADIAVLNWSSIYYQLSIAKNCFSPFLWFNYVYGGTESPHPPKRFLIVWHIYL